MDFFFRVNLITLVLCAAALNVAFVMASAASVSALEQTQPRLSDATEAAEEEIAIYRQPMGAQERYSRASASGGKVSFYPTYRFGSMRLISPYALQHLLASRFQNADYPGKRMGSEFLGKKRSSPSFNDNSLSLDSSPAAFAVIQKKMGSEFLGRRKRHLAAQQ